jgi:hypothetical protein
VESNLGNWVSFLNDKVSLIRRSFFPLMGESWLGTNMVYILYANMRKVANFQNVCFRSNLAIGRINEDDTSI